MKVHTEEVVNDTSQHDGDHKKDGELQPEIDTSQVAGKVPDGNPIKVAVSDDSSYAIYNSENIDGAKLDLP